MINLTMGRRMVSALVRGGRQGEERAGQARWTLSVSHDGGMAIALVGGDMSLGIFRA